MKSIILQTLSKQKLRMLGTVVFLGTAISLFAQPMLLIPDSGLDEILGFDPVDGTFRSIVVPNDGRLQLPKNAIDSGRNTILISDQNADAVFEYSYAGVYLRTIADNTTHGIDNIRGIAVRNGQIYIANAGQGGSPLQNTIQRINLDGTGQITWANMNLNSPYDILIRANDVLVSNSTSDDIERFDLNGAYLGKFVDSSSTNDIQFPQQLIERANGNILIAGFSTPTGVYEFSPTGTLITRHNTGGGPRGIFEMGNGKFLFSSGTDLNSYDPATGMTGIVYGGSTVFSFQYIELVNVPDTNMVTFTGTVTLGSWVGSATPITTVPVTLIVNGVTSTVQLSGTGNVGTFTVDIPAAIDSTIKVKPQGFLSQTINVTAGSTSGAFNGDGTGLTPGDADLNQDNRIDDFDLAAVIFDFGYSGVYPTSNGYSDTNGDGKTDDFDLAAVIFGFAKVGS